MATPDTPSTNKDAKREEIFANLDELLYGKNSTSASPSYASGPKSKIFADLNSLSIDIGNSTTALAEAKRISANTSDKAYRRLTARANVTSYSKLSQLHQCPRKYELDQLEANNLAAVESDTPNLHFAFGHSVGAGIQTYAATRSLQAALFAGFLAWKAPWDAEQTNKKDEPTGKSLTWAQLAIEKFGYFAQRELSEFEVVKLPDGRPATELSFAIDMENGYYHFGHIDTVLRSNISGGLVVWEGKTTGFENIDEATYANSSQALGYSVVVDAIAQQLGASGTEYEVLYIVYSSSTREFQLLPFGKSRTQRAEFLQDLLLDHATLKQYQTLKFYPKRGESCYNAGFRSRCHWFGQCTMSNKSLFADLEVRKLESVEEVESVDFKFTLSELVAAQRGTTVPETPTGELK